MQVMFKVWYCSGISLLILFYAFSPFRMEKGFIFQIQAESLVFVTALSWVGSTVLFIKKNCITYILKTLTRIDLLAVAFLIYLLLQLIFYRADREYILTIVSLSAVYFLFRCIPKKLVVGLLVLLPVLVGVQIIYGYNRFEYPWQTLSDNTGAFNNTGIFGGFGAMGFVSALGLLISSKKLVFRIALGIFLLPIIIQLVYSHSRAAWVAAVVGTIVLLIPAFRKLTRQKINVIISILLIAGVFFSIKLYHFKQNSAEGRLLIWTVSWNMLKEKPLTGFGPGGFRENYPLRQGDYFKNHPDSHFSDLADDIGYPFNEFLKTGIEQGFIGLILMIGILFLAFSNNSSPPVLRAVLAALVGFSCFSYPFDVVAFQVLGVFCLAGIASTQKRVAIASSTSNSLKTPVIADLTRNPLKLIATGLIIAFCGVVLFFSFNYFNDVKKWNQIIRSYSFGNEKQITEFQNLYPVFQHNDKFVFIYGKALYDSRRYAEAIPLLETAKEIFPHTQTLITLGEAFEKTGEYSKALENWETASYIRPSLFKPHYNMAKLYFNLKNYAQARQQARAVLNKKIKIDNPEIDRMKRECLNWLASDP